MTSNGRRSTLPIVLLIAGVTLVAFALRVYRLDTQSVWGDEAWTIFHATRESPLNVLRSAHDDGVVPPAYYLTLHPWLLVAGRSPFAVRYLSVVMGVLAVPAMFLFGRHIGGRWVGAIAAVLHALSPFHVYYSQEARMYAPMVLFTILSSAFFWRLLTEPRLRRAWVGYVVASGLAVNTHYFSWYLILAHGIIWLGVLIWSGFRAWRVALRCLAGQGATFLLFLPWMAYVWDRARGLAGQVEGMSVPLAVILRRCLDAFTAGVPVITGPPRPLAWTALVPFLLLAALAGLWPWRRRAWAFLVTCFVVPILATFLVSFPELPGWPRYFIAASPPFTLLVAQGAAGFWPFVVSTSGAGRRRLATGLVLLMVAPLSLIQAGSLRRYFTDPTFWRWDYRGQVARMTQDEPVSTAVVVNGKRVPFLLDYLFPPDAPDAIVPSVCDGDEQRIVDEIAALAAEHERIWLIRSMPLVCDENHRAAQWLKEHAYQVEEIWMENTVFDLFLTPSDVGEYAPPAQAPATFGDRFELVGVAVNARAVAPGDGLAVALRWHVLEDPERDYKFFLLLLGPDGEVFALKDGMPLNWLRPTSTWRAGERVDDRWGVRVDDGTPAGTYPLYVGAYDPTTGQRLPVLGPGGRVVGDKLTLVWIEIVEIP